MNHLRESARLGDYKPKARMRSADEYEVIRLIGGRGIEARIRDASTGELIQSGRIPKNVVLDAVKATLLQRLFGVSGSVRTISQIAVGSGTTAPSSAQVALVSQIALKAIASVDQSGEASIPPSRICVVTFGSSEANGAGTSYIRELGFAFDNNTIVTRALFAQGIIENASQTDPVVITSTGCQAALTAAGAGNGSQVFIEGVSGMTQLNGNHYTIANLDTNDFELDGIDGTGFGAFTPNSPPTEKWTLEFEKNSSRVLEISYPFALEC